MKHSLYLTIGFLLLNVNYLSAQNYLSNGYIQDEVIKVSCITSDNQIYNLTSAQKQTTRYYYDGLGRIIQTIALQASPLQKDVVKISSYDGHGQQTHNYLPYIPNNGNGSFRSNPITEQAAYYSNGTTDKVADDNSPYSQQIFENSPLQRILTMGNIGDGFQPGQHYKSLTYRSNNSADAIILWGADGVKQANYAAGLLSGTQLIDEQGHITQVFKDPEGKIILKRKLINEVINGVTEFTSDTYYIYNNIGSLIYTISPKAIAIMRSSGNWSLSQSAVDKLIYKYIYDNQGRLIEKTVPGQSALYIIYDPLNRPVLLQDGNLRSLHKWNFIKYDLKGRAVSQGLYTDEANISRAAMQSYISTLDYSINYYEERSSTSANGYYTNNSFPSINTESLAYAYYDDYDLNQDGQADYSYKSQGLSNEDIATTHTRGMLTIMSKRTLGDGLNKIWLNTVNFYNKQGVIIQSLNNNQINTALTDSKTIVADFTGKPIQQKVVKFAGTTSTTVLSDYTYDNAGRIKAIDQSYNGSTALRIASYEYNEVGQLVRKKLNDSGTNANLPTNITLNADQRVASGATVNTEATNSIILAPGFVAEAGSNFKASISAGPFLQGVDYRYNIRGEMLSINNSTLTADEKNEDSNDVFGMEIKYDNVDGLLGNTGYYNGMVSAVKWMAKTTTHKERSYKFSYDDQNRLTGAIYGDRSLTESNWTNSNAFDEKNISYDQNGNIMTLKRNAVISGTITPIDDLNYSYDGNQLSNVTDGTGANYAAVGFKNLTGSLGVYEYNSNGDLVTDAKKGLKFAYNSMNKAEKITVTTSPGRYINNTYDADGNLLRKQLYDNNVLQKTTDYIDGFVYEGGVLSYFPMPEGRIRNTGSELKPEYMITDQQGNVRVSFEEQNGVAVLRQENSYYPFGLIMPNSEIATPTAPNRNLYNAGSEWQNDFGDLPDLYHTFFREYDPTLGRFTGVDPAADNTESISVYQYALNNPLLYNDPRGDYVQGKTSLKTIIGQLLGYENGGTWSAGIEPTEFQQQSYAFAAGSKYLTATNSWGVGSAAKNYNSALADFNKTPGSQDVDKNPNKRATQTMGWYHSEDGTPYTKDGVSGVGNIEFSGTLAVANQGNNEENEIPEGYSKAFDATAFGTDFHSISLTAATMFLKDVGEPLLKYNRGVGAVGAVASLATVGVHLYNHHATWKDGVSGTLGVANLVLIAIPGIGEAVVGLELTVALGTIAWDAYNQYQDANQYEDANQHK